MDTFLHNLKQVLIALDQLLNTLVGLFLYKEKTWADESFSSLCYRWEQDGVRSWPRKLVDNIFFWQDRHCWQSYVSEKERNQLPPEYRKN